MRLDDPWKLREVALSDNDLALLSVTADNLNGTLPEFEIEDEELKVVRSQLYDLRKEIGEADITAKLKSALLAEMSRLIDAVENYRVVGAPGLRRAAAEAFGQIIIEREGFLSAREAPWVAKYFTVVSRLADLAALAVMGHELALNAVDTLNRLLPPPTV